MVKCQIWIFVLMLQISFARPVDAVQTYSMGAIVETLYLIAKNGPLD